MDTRNIGRVSRSVRSEINDFLDHKRLAIVGVSKGGAGFGNLARKELARAGYTLTVVHPTAAAIDGQPCARSLAEVADEVDGVLLVTPPVVTEQLVREARAAGVRRVWMQQGAESEEAIRYCQEHEMTVVHHECVLMFLDSAGFVHRAHRWMRGALGQMPPPGPSAAPV